MTTFRVITMVVAVLALAGCGGSTTNAPSSSASQPQSQQPQSPGLVIDITISNGSVTPTNAEFKAKVRQPIELRVTSDAPDELHVHSLPDDHTFNVEAKPNQTFEFTVDIPGQVEVELHKLDRTVATIAVEQ